MIQGTPDLFTDPKLHEAAKEFALLAAAQQQFFKRSKQRAKTDRSKQRIKPDYPQKAYNMAVLSAWPYVAGLLHDNEPRLKRHFALRNAVGKDPLNAAALADGRHDTDAENYRGLGYRTDARERGRFVELFYLQAEDGSGITPRQIKLAIMIFHAKQAQLAATKEREKRSGG